jgi:hypothetical protein
MAALHIEEADLEFWLGDDIKRRSFHPVTFFLTAEHTYAANLHSSDTDIRNIGQDPWHLEKLVD